MAKRLRISRKRIYKVNEESEIYKIDVNVERRKRMFGQAVRDIMDQEGISWMAAKKKLQEELRLLRMQREMRSIKSA